MADSFPNNVKALFCPVDLTGGKGDSISSDSCLTLQHFDYLCDKWSEQDGFSSSGLSSSVFMTLSVKMRSPQDGKFFYEALKSKNSTVFTIFFNAVADDKGNIRDYYEAMTVTGYVTDISELFTTLLDENRKSNPMTLTVKVLLSSITYFSNDSSKTLQISQG